MKKPIPIIIVLLLLLFVIQEINLTSLAVKGPLIIQQQASIKSTLTKLSITVLSILILTTLIIYLRARLHEKKAANISKIKSILKHELTKGIKPSAITPSLLSKYPPSAVRQAFNEFLEEFSKD